MSKTTLKDLNYTAYELGIAEGKSVIIAQFSGVKKKPYGADPLELLESMWPDRTIDEFEEMIVEDGTIEDVLEVAKSFMDGIEDGVRTIRRWLQTYEQSIE